MSVKDYKYVYNIVCGEKGCADKIITIFANSDKEVNEYIKSNDDIMRKLAGYFCFIYPEIESDVGEDLVRKFRKTLDCDLDEDEEADAMCELDYSNKKNLQLIREVFQETEYSIIRSIGEYTYYGEYIIVACKKVSDIKFVNRKKKYKTLFEIPKNPTDITIVHQS